MRRTLVALCVALSATLAFAAPATAKSYKVVNADVGMRLLNDGELLVREDLTFAFNGGFEGAYRDIPLLPHQSITAVQVSEGARVYKPGGNTILGSYDRPGVFGTEDSIEGARGERVVWHYRASDEVRTFTITYRVEGGAIAYDDVIDVGWTVWGDQWSFDLDHLSASFTNPALDPANPDYRVWGHPRDVEGSTARGDGVATLEASDVHDHTAVEFRITMPRPANIDTTGMQVRDGDGLPTILAEEKALDEDFDKPWPKTKRFLAHHVVAAGFGFAGLAALVMVLLVLFARERRTATPRYLPEPPDDAGPALAYGLVHEGGDSKNTVLATLLDLVDRGYYETTSTTTDKEKLDLALKAKSETQRPKDEKLTEYEREVLEFFDSLLEGESVPISEMRDRIPKHSEVWRDRWRKMTEKLDAADEGQLGWDRDLNTGRGLLTLAMLIAFGVLTVAYIQVEEKWLLPIALGIATLIGIFCVPRHVLRRVDAAHRERMANWQAFERWTEDFPRLSDDPPQTLELWKRILVYGVAFGTAERMIKSGRIPEPVMDSAGTSGGWSAYAFSNSFNFSTLNGSAFSSGFSSQVAPQSSSGGGGGFSGGFSGGGSFGGGGGGGAW
ncbi:MAG: DUF2207 family protein [Solirubrobacterales bacterium]